MARSSIKRVIANAARFFILWLVHVLLARIEGGSSVYRRKSSWINL